MKPRSQVSPGPGPNLLEPIYDGLEELSELGGILRCAIFEEPGIGSGVPGKIGKDLSKHPNSFDLGFDCCEPASVVGFDAFSDVAIGFTWLYGGAFIQCGGRHATADS